MHRVNGKNGNAIEAAVLAAWASHYHEVTVDLGTGDGRYVRDLARRCPAAAAIGIDICRENLERTSRTAPDNALFLVADALALPAELDGLATRLTINFPWGSLLRGLAEGHAGLLGGLRRLGRGDAPLEVTLNAGALAELGLTLEVGGERVAAVLAGAGFAVPSLDRLGPEQLRRCPTTWAKRLAFSRDPRALRIAAALT